jgi:hypothetical protein
VRGYVPPPSRGNPPYQRIRGGASRGCDRAFNNELTLLAPSDHMALTTQAHPTFFFHLSNTPEQAVRFTLVEPEVAEPILEKTIPVAESGVIEVTLPSQSPNLEVGKNYRWSVSLVCNPQRPSQNVFAFAWIERIAVPSELSKELAQAPNYSALTYAQAGIWYDALANSYGTSLILFGQLIEQIGLIGVTQPFSRTTDLSEQHQSELPE